MLNRIVTSREALLMAAIIVLLGLVATRFPSFVAPSNLLAVFNDTSPLILLAIGQMIVILTKCIDLSVAANLALTGMVVAMINVVAPRYPCAGHTGGGDLHGHTHGYVQWFSGMETRHTSYRCDAWDHDDFSRHYLPDLGWKVG